MSATVPSPVNTRTIDHLVHLTPPGSVIEVSNKFRELGFTVLPGGSHADGLTTNALVVLGDGSYLELISFTHPVFDYPEGSPERARRESHRWANEAPGWIDYAFLGNGSTAAGERVSETINNRASGEDGSDVVYLPEVDGGRVRPDGEVLKWLITAPDPTKSEVGTLPFFCGDVTPRSRRVQTEPNSDTEHPSTALGIAYIRLLAYSKSILWNVKNELTTVIGRPPNRGSNVWKATWDLDCERPTRSGRLAFPQLILETPEADGPEKGYLLSPERNSNGIKGIGIYEIGIFVEELRGGSPEEVRTPYGKIKFVRIDSD